MDRHLFISYRRSDSGVVDELLAALNDRFRCWRDTARIAGGQVWREEITRALDAAYAMVLVVSPETDHSKEIYAEYFYALGRKVPIIPLLINQCQLPFGLENVNARLWYKDKQLAVRELRGDLDLYHQRAPGWEPMNDVVTYLNALQLGYLMNVGNYTPMAGEGRFRRERVVRRPQAVIMRPEFSLRRSSPLFGERQIEDQRKQYDDLLPALHEAKQVVVLGEPGIGKTTTLYKFADELRLRALENDSAPLPLIIPLREWRGDFTWESLIARHLGVLGPRYEQLLSSKRLFFLIDGLNELPRDDQRSDKLGTLRVLLQSGAPAIVTCRELDYRDESLRLDLDKIAIHPLEPERVLDFLTRYLADGLAGASDPARAEDLFWQIGGGNDVKAVWEKWRAAGASLNKFFTAAAKSDEVRTSWSDEELRQDVVNSPASLIHLMANPYLLWMFLQIYFETGAIPANRGALFDEFVFQLLKREGLTVDDKLNAEGQGLSARLEKLAWTMQSQAVALGEKRRGVELTISRSQAIQSLGSEEGLYRAGSANLLEDAEPVRFTHQLLQEYFIARRVLAEANGGTLQARDLWPEWSWWFPSGWEEAVVLAVGMGGKGAESVVYWLAAANPEVAAMAMQRSGAQFSDQFKTKFREEWLPQMTDLNRHPKAAARAAIGRALGSVSLSSGEPLDNRPGVGLTSDGLPDIDWVDIPGGTVRLEDVKADFKVKPFRIGRYLVTNRQFQAFVDAPDGYGNKKWWKEIEPSPAPIPPEWSEVNHPRETVSWYEAVAFCRWLSDKYHERGLLGKGGEIRLPTEWEWQQAATNGRPDNVYPWGGSWDSTLCNSRENYQLTGTSAVGLYPHGTWPGGPLDMAGHVWEWCLNKYENPKGWEATKIDKSGQRVVRGGSWENGPVYLRSSHRGRGVAVSRTTTIGFRLARDIS